jgi:hypothetical protein
MEGWISVHRKIWSHWLIEKSRPFTRFEAWLKILSEANHDPNTVLIGNELITVNRGESLNSLDTWAKLFNWKKSKVRRFLKLLESDSMIELKPNRKTTHLFVCNYESYQPKRNTDETQMKRKRHANGTQTAPNNKDNKDNKDNNKSKGFDFVEPEFKKPFYDFLEYKAARKEKYKSDKSLKAAYNKLKKLSGNNPDVAAEIVEQSMANNWAGLFELKNSKSFNPTDTRTQPDMKNFNEKF